MAADGQDPLPDENWWTWTSRELSPVGADLVYGERSLDAAGDTVVATWRSRDVHRIAVSQDRGRTLSQLQLTDEVWTTLGDAAIADDAVLVAGRTGRPRLVRAAFDGARQDVLPDVFASELGLPAVTADGDRVVVAGRAADQVVVLTSRDGARSWTEELRFTPAARAGRLVVDTRAGTSALATTERDATTGEWRQVAYVSADGAPWTRHDLGPTRQASQLDVAVRGDGAVAVASAQPDGIRTRRMMVSSTNGGATWSAETISQDGLGADREGLPVALSADESSWVYVERTFENVYRKDIGGRWATLRLTDPTDLAWYYEDAPVAASGGEVYLLNRTRLVHGTSYEPKLRIDVTRRPSVVRAGSPVSIRWRMTGVDPSSVRLECWTVEGLVRYVACPHLGGGVYGFDGRAGESLHVDLVRRDAWDGSIIAGTTIRWEVDSFGPGVGFPGGHESLRLVTGERVRFRWKATDDTRVTRVDVRVRRGLSHARRPAWTNRTPKYGNGPMSLDLRLARGTTACVQVRPHDAVGRVGSWSDAGCASRAYGRKATKVSGPAARLRGRRFADGWAVELRADAALRVPAGRGSRVALVVTEKPRPETIFVKLPGRRASELYDVERERGTRYGVITDVSRMTAKSRGRVRVAVNSIVGRAVVEGIIVVPAWANVT
ncbi:hypothetical protein [Mumia sp. DW29H23]|uniref:hypothetical protein n=1 Tax=Mumia sp. DW29H23 TaxID=3421241 RepID=UPI003D69042D